MVNKVPTLRLTVGATLVFIYLYTFLIHQVFWHIPLSELDALSTSTQDDRFSDPNFYLFNAANICRLDAWGIEDLLVTWSSLGVVGYLTVGCLVFGSEFFYVFFNPALVAIAFGIALRAAHITGLNVRVGPLSVFALPYTFLTISLPGKETIAVFGVMLIVSGLLFVTARLRSNTGLFLIFFGILLVGINRAHEAVAIFIFCTVWIGGLSAGWLRWVLLGAIFSIVSILGPQILAALQLSATADSITDISMWSGSSEGKAVNADALFDSLRSDDLLLHLLLGIPRVIIVLLAPLSSLVTQLTDADWAYYIFRDLSQRLRLIDMVFILVVFCVMLRVYKKMRWTEAGKTFWLLPSFFLFMVYVIVFFGVSQKSRYIFQYTPLLMLWLWCWRSRKMHCSRRLSVGFNATSNEC